MCLCANIMTSASDCQPSREGWGNRRETGDLVEYIVLSLKKKWIQKAFWNVIDFLTANLLSFLLINVYCKQKKSV